MGRASDRAINVMVYLLIKTPESTQLQNNATLQGELGEWLSESLELSQDMHDWNVVERTIVTELEALASPLDLWLEKMKVCLVNWLPKDSKISDCRFFNALCAHIASYKLSDGTVK